MAALSALVAAGIDELSGAGVAARRRLLRPLLRPGVAVLEFSEVVVEELVF